MVVGELTNKLQECERVSMDLRVELNRAHATASQANEVHQTELRELKDKCEEQVWHGCVYVCVWEIDVLR